MATGLLLTDTDTNALTTETKRQTTDDIMDVDGYMNSIQKLPSSGVPGANYEDEDSDTEDDINNQTEAPGHVRRSTQRLTMEEFIRDNIDVLSEPKIQKETPIHLSSIRSMMARQETAMVHDPREYQKELFQRAVERNTIAVLDTGSGKTLIAVLLLKHILADELQRRGCGAPPKIAFFLVNATTLVFQQFSVLEANLGGEFNLDRMCGKMAGDAWNKKTWDRVFNDNHIVVCTAEILYQCLFHSFLKMEQINLLIFDEAHHAKQNHPYARIVREFYRKEPQSTKRPRIFGMTASPVDAKVDPLVASKELEEMLDSFIATFPLADEFRNKAQEHTLIYSRLQPEFETPFCQEIKKRFGGVRAFEKLFTKAKAMSSIIGPWGADMYWSFAFADEQTRKAETNIEKLHFGNKETTDVRELDTDMKLLRQAADYVRAHNFDQPLVSNLSSKVWQLKLVLANEFERSHNYRCIVFVEQRVVARLLHLIFSRIGGTHLKSGLLTGAGSRSVGELSQSFRQQVLTLVKFRNGDINCLFATSIAEEGLDIPDCNTVIRFDLYKSVIGYVQSKGRARHPNSKFIHMVERDNPTQRQAVVDVRRMANTLTTWCHSLPEDRVVQDYEADLTDDMPDTVYVDPSTGARVNFTASLSILAHFAAMVPTGGSTVPPPPEYVVIPEQGKFISEVILHSSAPIARYKGTPQARKSLAKRSAAFEMCVALRKANYLDHNFLPIYQRALPAMRNAQLALTSNKRREYTMRIKPSIWEEGRGVLPSIAYLTIMDVSDALERPHQPLGLLTRKPLPQLPHFPLFLSDHRQVSAVITPLDQPIPVDNDISMGDGETGVAALGFEGIDSPRKLNIFHANSFSFYFFWDIFHKEFENAPEKMSYWLVPIIPGTESEQSPLRRIDIDLLRKCFQEKEIVWTPEMPHEYLKDRFIVDRWSGARRFFSIEVDSTKNAMDPVPDAAPKFRWRKSILDYSIGLWKGSRVRTDWDERQPVIIADLRPLRQTYLNKLTPVEERKLREPKRAWICPQPLKISTLPTTIVAMAGPMPAMIHRLEDYLITLEACNLIGIEISPSLALEALTKDSENSEEHQVPQLNFREGMGANYERLEFLGDCFLKMATSIALYGLRPNDNEFDSHVNRMVMVSNKNLLDNAIDMRLFEYTRSQAFNRNVWYPRGIKLLSGKGAERTGPRKPITNPQEGVAVSSEYPVPGLRAPAYENSGANIPESQRGVGDQSKPKNMAITLETAKHGLGDKTIADCCEALMGAAFLQYNRPGNWNPRDWDAAVKAVTVFVKNENHLMQKWDDYVAGYELPAYQTAACTAAQLKLAEKVQKLHPYEFKYPRLLRAAFTHPSYPSLYDGIPSYQRLEFLGDSLHDMACVSHLFYNFPGKDPQWLTEHKSAMVGNKFLGALCVQLGFWKCMNHSNSQMGGEIASYAEAALDARSNSGGQMDWWISAPDPPKCLSDIVEAFIGAIFVDSGFNYSVVQRFFDMHILPFFIDMTLYDNFASGHPTTMLAHRLADELGCESFGVRNTTLPSTEPIAAKQEFAAVIIHNKVVEFEVGDSGRYAKVRASAKAYQKLDGLSPAEFRELYSCDCESKRAERKEAEIELEKEKPQEIVGTNI